MRVSDHITASRWLLVAAFASITPAWASQTFTNYTTADGLADNYVQGIYATNGSVYIAHVYNSSFLGGGMTIMTQGGATFTSVQALQGSIPLSVTGSGSHVYAGNYYGGIIAISDDNGTTWTTSGTAYADPQIAWGNGFITDISASGSKVVVGTESLGLGISYDSGATWTTKYLPGATSPTYGYQAALDAVHFNQSSIYVGIRGELSGAWVYSALGITKNDGATWSTVNLGSQIFDITTSNGYLYVATSAGLRVSADDGQTWNLYTTANGLGANQVNAIVAAAGYLFAATPGGLGVSTNNGLSWRNYTTADGLLDDGVTSLYADASMVYVGNYNGLNVASVSSLGAIPEPSTYGMALGALALSGSLVRRRRKTT